MPNYVTNRLEIQGKPAEIKKVLKFLAQVSCESRIEDGNVFFFLTAWSAVPDLMLKLGLIFPEVKFIYKWADENLGCNTGWVVFTGTEVIESCVPKNHTKEAYELAFELLKVKPEDYHLRRKTPFFRCGDIRRLTDLPLIVFCGTLCDTNYVEGRIKW